MNQLPLQLRHTTEAIINNSLCLQQTLSNFYTMRTCYRRNTLNRI